MWFRGIELVAQGMYNLRKLKSSYFLLNFTSLPIKLLLSKHFPVKLYKMQGTWLNLTVNFFEIKMKKFFSQLKTMRILVYFQNEHNRNIKFYHLFFNVKCFTLKKKIICLSSYLNIKSNCHKFYKNQKIKWKPYCNKRHFQLSML